MLLQNSARKYKYFVSFQQLNLRFKGDYTLLKFGIFAKMNHQNK